MSAVLLFDLDGTLVDSLPDLTAALNRTLGAALSEAEVRPMVGDGAAALVARALERLGRPADAHALPRFLADYEANAAVASRPFPGIEGALDALAADGWRMAVCTNKPERVARALLDALGLGPRFAAVGGGDSFAVRKPDPGHLRATVAAAGGRRAAALIGDHANDVRAAAAGGVPCLFAAWGYGESGHAAGAAAILPAPAALPAAVAALGARP